MPQICRVCTHPDREAIDAALANRDSLRTIGAQYGVSKDSLLRHYRAHIERSEPRTATSEPQSDGAAIEDRYRAFIARFRGQRARRAEVATWGFDPREVEVFIKVALERGDLSSS